MSAPPPSRSDRDPPAAAHTWTQVTAHDSDAPREHGVGQSRADGDGPEPSTTTVDCSDPQQSDPAVAAVLHRHALESVFAFLGLRELAAALRVARDWLSAAKSMRRLDLRVEWLTAAALGQIAYSPMGRHISRLKCGDLDADALAVFAARMAHLRELNFYFEPSEAGQPISFPASLRLLNINILTVDAVEINAAIAAICRLPLLEELKLRLDRMGPTVSFAPLAALPLLRGLVVTSDYRYDKISDAQIDELRQMPRLREVDVPINWAQLRRLLRQPHNLQWQQISLPTGSVLDDETAALLLQLPSLTAISGTACCDDFDWLRGLPNLTDVTLHGEWPWGADLVASLVAALQCCTDIEKLRFDWCYDLTAAHLAELLPRLPKLRELRLDRSSVDSLAFLAQPPITSRLSLLRLCCCGALPPAELRHVHGLRGLTHLTLSESFTAPLDSADLAQLTPPTILLPRLEKFEYQAR